MHKLSGKEDTRYFQCFISSALLLKKLRKISIGFVRPKKFLYLHICISNSNYLSTEHHVSYAGCTRIFSIFINVHMQTLEIKNFC